MVVVVRVTVMVAGVVAWLWYCDGGGGGLAWAVWLQRVCCYWAVVECLHGLNEEDNHNDSVVVTVWRTRGRCQ